MEKELYSMIFKRKSFHIFRDIGSINPDELQSIEEKYNNLTPLINGIEHSKSFPSSINFSVSGYAISDSHLLMDCRETPRISASCSCV